MTEQSPEPVIYQYSVKIEMDSKGLAKPTVHVYGDNGGSTRLEAVALYIQTINDLVAANQPVAVEVGKK